MDPKGLLILETPPLRQAPEPSEISTLELEAELAEYAKKHLGYSVLSEKIVEEKGEKRISLVKIAEANSLPLALRDADIRVYNAESVKRYQKAMVRKAWMKYMFSWENSLLYCFLFYFIQLASGAMVLGGFNRTGSIIAATASLGISFMALRARSKDQGGSVITTELIVFLTLPAVAVILGTSSHWWLVLTVIISATIMWGNLPEFYSQFTESKIVWHRRSLNGYTKKMPIFALGYARQIHQVFPRARFFVEELVSEVYLPDPFLIVSDPATGVEFYVAVWEEPKFEAENR